MNDLFNSDETPVETPVETPRKAALTPPASLAAHAGEYKRGGRPAADPIGLAGLPDTRRELDGLLAELCNRLAAACGEMVHARRLVAELDLSGDRALRLLMAYGHVHHRLRELVGIEGVGYCWGGADATAYGRAAAIARRKGLCSLFLASLYSKKPAAVELAQMTLDFAKDTGAKPRAKADELDAWLAGEHVTPADLIEAMVSLYEAHPEGREALKDAARRHPGVFVEAGLLGEIEDTAKRLLGAVEKARKAG